MDPQSIAVTAGALIVVAVLFLLLGRRLAGPATAELTLLREAKVSLEQRLAVAEYQATKVPGLEEECRTLATAKAEVDRRHAEEAALAARGERELLDVKAAMKASQEGAELERRRTADLRAQLAALNETLAQERQQAAKDLKLLQDTRDAMTREFKLLAAEVMKEHGEAFAKKNIEQLDGTLNPLRLKIHEFQQILDGAHKESAKERAVLADQIRTLTERSVQMSSETQNLTQALKGKSQMQGAWGEMVLATILQKSGLREGEEYVVQQSHTTEDGGRLRPDVIVHLPNGQSIVIDAKVSLTAYAAAVAAETDEERAAQLRGHVLSIRQHVRALASKEYHKHAGALDYVVMFVPIEGALAAALSEAPDLTGTAVESNVYIATPTTLMIALRTAANVWHVERRNRNAEEIAGRAGSIYDKIFAFAANMEKLGNALGSAHDAYDKAIGQLSRGKGNVLRQLEDLKRLGAKTGKSLPLHLVEDDQAPAITDEAAEA